MLYHSVVARMLLKLRDRSCVPRPCIPWVLYLLGGCILKKVAWPLLPPLPTPALQREGVITLLLLGRGSGGGTTKRHVYLWQEARSQDVVFLQPLVVT